MNTGLDCGRYPCYWLMGWRDEVRDQGTPDYPVYSETEDPTGGGAVFPGSGWSSILCDSRLYVSSNGKKKKRSLRRKQKVLRFGAKEKKNKKEFNDMILLEY